MRQTEYLDQIRQVLQWIKDEEEFRGLFFHSPEEALRRLEHQGFPLSDRARRFLSQRVTPESFQEEYERFFPTEAGRGESLAVPSLPLPPVIYYSAAKPVAANGGGEETPERVVSTGFAGEVEPHQPLDAYVPLLASTSYYFWFEVGEPVEGSIEEDAVDLPFEDLPPEAVLQVVLFAYENEFEIIPGADIGEIKLMPDGAVGVVRAAATPTNLPDNELLARRLFFPVRTPASEAKHRLRCNVYFQQNLVQSRLITFEVRQQPQRMDTAALLSQVDYTLSKTLRREQLHGMGENRLSLMLNDNGNGTHGFRFFGQGEFKNDASLSAGDLANLIEIARGALRDAAWGDKEPYAEGKLYRYDGAIDEKKLLGDLISMALRGKRFYDALANQIAGDADKASALETLMAKPGQVQLASKESARLVVPLAMFYDYRLDDGQPTAAYTLCPSFQTALRGDVPLEETPCFQGECPTRKDLLVVCPSGFWGFRHSLGMPVSVRQAPDAPSSIQSHAGPRLAVSVSTDPDLIKRPQHEQTLQAMGFGWEYADTRDETIEMLRSTESQVVYFYCHGGLTPEKFPYLSVGPPGESRLTRSNLRDYEIRWRDVRPLVFINGCHTTALTPEAAIDLVSGFVETSHAAGVVGTEITIFEPIAVAFAEEFFDRFLKKGQTLGDAMRGARLKMLKDGNPLGLVYIPYALPGLRVAPSPN